MRVHGEAVAGEARVNPDGSIDLQHWSRPQNDGPASRAIIVLRWLTSLRGKIDEADANSAARLLRMDLDFTLQNWFTPCFDIWEEEEGLHYYTLRVQAAALSEGAQWLAAEKDYERARACESAAARIRAMLDDSWLESEGYYRSRLTDATERNAKNLNMAVVLAALHADGADVRHSVRDPRMFATLSRLEHVFRSEYLINQDLSSAMGPAMGRYAGDTYYSGGAYYFSTLAAAEFYFRLSAASTTKATRPDATETSAFAKGDAFLRTVQRFTPDNGAMSEQFDQNTGEQTSAKHLAWSYAAFITCADARRSCLRPSSAA